MPTNYEQPARERLLNSLLEASWLEGLDNVSIVFGAASYSESFGGNAAVRYQTYDGTNYIGTFISGLDRDIIPAPFGLFPQLTATNVTTTWDLLPFVLSQHGVALLQEDVIDEPVVGDNYVLKSAPGSLGWVGQLYFNIDVISPPPGFLFLRTEDGQLVTSADGLYILVTQP